MAKTVILWIIILTLIAGLFSFRILESPLGLTADEGAFAYNATLLAKTGFDENGRYLPVFVLSLGGADWRQPVTQYYLTGFFKLFGATVFNLRFSSVVISLLSMVLIYYLAKQVYGAKGAAFSVAMLLSAPIMLIHSHLGLDNIMPVPFTIIWYWCVWKYLKTSQTKFLLFAGITLGSVFYTYKGMRAIVPTWTVLTVLAMYWHLGRQKLTHYFKPLVHLGLGLLPFVALMPVFQHYYPGSILGGNRPEIKNIYDFVYPWLSSFDPTFLFVTGDVTPWHSTGRHGMVLLASLPLLLTGIYQAATFKGNKFAKFVLLSFFLTPLLYGTINSVHRASRLMMLLPSFALLGTWGALWLWQQKKLLLVILVALGVWNWGDFTYHYWYKYPELTRQWFGDLTPYRDYEQFGKLIVKKNLKPYLDAQLTANQGMSGSFFESAYIGTAVEHINLETEVLPEGAAVMSARKQVPGLVELEDVSLRYYTVLTR